MRGDLESEIDGGCCREGDEGEEDSKEEVKGEEWCHHRAVCVGGVDGWWVREGL